MNNKLVCSLNDIDALDAAWTYVGCLSEMYRGVVRANLTIPNGFTILKDASVSYYENNKNIEDAIRTQILDSIKELIGNHGEMFGNVENPLLISVRTRARGFMPNLMKTILYLGINDTIANSMAMQSGNAIWVYDCYKTFVQTYSVAVKGIPLENFENIEKNFKNTDGNSCDKQFDADELKCLVDLFKTEYKAKTGTTFPDDPYVQLFNAIEGGFASWDNPEANAYRRENDIPFASGVAITIQSMIYTTKDSECGEGVVYTRCPESGEKIMTGHYFSGPKKNLFNIDSTNKMFDLFPVIYRQIKNIVEIVEKEWLYINEIHFAVQANTVYIMNIKRPTLTPFIAVKLACDFVDEGLLTERDASYMVHPEQLYELKKQEDLDSEFKEKFERVYGWAVAYDEYDFLEREMSRLSFADKNEGVKIEFNAEDINF